MDVLDVNHDPVWDDGLAPAWIGHGPANRRSRHAAHLSFHIEDRPATHAHEA
jgi:hypothetical protein